MLLCLHLYSSKDSIVSNTASAAVRQTVSAVFEHLKVHLDDGRFMCIFSMCVLLAVINIEGFFDVQVVKEESTDNSNVPGSLNTKAHDAYLLFQVL